MSQAIHTGQRLLRAAGITLALLGLATQGATAQEAPAQGAASLQVVKDAETGKLRAATAEEAAELNAQANAAKSRLRTRVVAPKQLTHPSGAVGIELGDEYLNSSVAVRKADGSIERQCFESHGAATTAVAKGHVHSNKAVSE